MPGDSGKLSSLARETQPLIGKLIYCSFKHRNGMLSRLQLEMWQDGFRGFQDRSKGVYNRCLH